MTATVVQLSGDRQDLTERERMILRAIIHLFILHATPVGSRIVSKYLEREFALSPATIRNVMSDLEEMGYITHPHTSAGRMPTDKGYRFYVDSLMGSELLSTLETETVLGNLRGSPRETVLRDASRVLGSLSHYLALVQLPQLGDVIVQKVEMLRLSSERLLVVVALESDIVRTVTIETHHLPEHASLDEITRAINERLAGRPLSMLNALFPDMLDDTHSSDGALIRLFVDHVGRLNDSSLQAPSSIHVAGTQNLLTHPEFDDPERMRSVIELVENEDVIIHLLGTAQENDGVAVRIGNELQNEQLQDYSLIATTYRVGSASGSVGLIGPKRMNYSRMVSLVQFVGTVLSSTLRSR
ncbi:MAG: heat-inducible transcription repressor HrcA ['Candidatus Kapabacteria' thiocyanatum]|nr:heat-inducible transcription repressor HrcA ['Candidatus Kapabacteria' thiocyanatum]